MPEHMFYGSYLGDASKLKPTDRLECKTCWWVYDPAKGDPDQNIEPGTPFADLPDYWTCPVCNSSKDAFLVIRENNDSSKH